MELTKKQVTAICNKVIARLENAKTTKECVFLCSAIKIEIAAIEYRELHSFTVEEFIPEFTKVNAVIMANAIEEWSGNAWWYGSKSGFDYDSRIKFMEFIKECYTNNN